MTTRARMSVEVTGDAFELRDLGALKTALEAASVEAAEIVKGTWVSVAQQMGVRRTGEYVRGIEVNEARWKVHQDDGDMLQMELELVNTAEHAAIVEEGHNGFHLPSRIDWNGPRVKSNPATGKRWLTIPLRHRAYASPAEREAGGYTASAVKAMMPPRISSAARGLKSSRAHRAGPVRDHAGRFIAADRYTWGGRLRRAGPRAAGGPPVPGEHRPHWTSSKYEGMVRFHQRTAGGRGQSRYVTFRTITPDSQGWHIPPLAGKRVAQRVAHAFSAGPGRSRLEDRIVHAIETALGGPIR